MSGLSSIEWTEATWNPLTGCELISPGCDHCYAARESAGRLRGVPAYSGLTVEGAKPARFTGEVRLLPERLRDPLRWRKPRRVFVNSMSDLFHRDVPYDYIVQVWAVMIASGHEFQVLTKRPKRMAEVVGSESFQRDVTRVVHEEHQTHMFAGWPYPTIWLGTSIESDRYAWRADHLRTTPAAVRFVSAEPLLGPLPSLDLAGIDWLIVGGESGPGARPMHPDWVRDLRDRRPSRPAFFFKQWGAWTPTAGDGVEFGRWVDPVTGDTYATSEPGRVLMSRYGKKGRVLDGVTWDEFPVGGVR